MRNLFTVILCLAGSLAWAQLSYAHSVYNETSEAGTMVTPNLKVKNTSANTVEVFVNRIYLNLPTNWTQCFCFIECQPPTLDSLRFNLLPGETVDIGIGFNTDTIPGIGYMKLTIEAVGSSQKDTLSFSGSTYLFVGVKEQQASASINVFPNPVSSDFLFTTTSTVDYQLDITDISGNILYESPLIRQQNYSISLEALPPGRYFVRASFSNGHVKTQTLIKK